MGGGCLFRRCWYSGTIFRYQPNKVYKTGIEYLRRQAIPKAKTSWTEDRFPFTKQNSTTETDKTLTQLMSGWCRLLNSCNYRIYNSIPNTYPISGASPLDVMWAPIQMPKWYLICRYLVVQSLWTYPSKATLFCLTTTTLDAIPTTWAVANVQLYTTL